MSKLNMKELQDLVDNFTQDKEKGSVKNYTAKVNQQDGNITLTVYDGNEEVYQLLENYKLDKDSIKTNTWCHDSDCTEFRDYIITDSSRDNIVKLVKNTITPSIIFLLMQCSTTMTTI